MRYRVAPCLILATTLFFQGCGGSEDPTPAAKALAAALGSTDSAAKSSSAATGANPCLPDGCDVILLAGQSNMVGWNNGNENQPAQAAPDARVLQWNEARQAIEPATDAMNWLATNATRPLGSIGPGLSFGKAYVRSLGGTRRVLLVPAAVGGTGFYRGNWNPPAPGVTEGPLVTAAISLANHAMAVASVGVPAKFAGILWQQGEADVNDSSYGGVAPENAYESNLLGLIDTFRARITGATIVTGQRTTYAPFVAGEMPPQWTHWYNGSNQPPPLSPLQLHTKATILRIQHALPELRPYTAWVSSAGLQSNASGQGNIHFEKDSQRQLGLRYADKLFEASNGLPQAAVALKYWNGSFFNIGPDLSLGQALPSVPPPVVIGQVAAVNDAERGWVAKISRSAGAIQFSNTPADLLNGSYTKSAWLKLDGYGYSNNLVSGAGMTQSHAFYFPNPKSGFIAAGHNSAGLPRADYVRSATQVPADGRTWTHLCVTYSADSQTMSLYVNGLVSASKQGVPAAAEELMPTTLQLSGYGTYNNVGIDGQMIDNRLYSSALTPSQVAAIYNYESRYRAGF